MFHLAQWHASVDVYHLAVSGLIAAYYYIRQHHDSSGCIGLEPSSWQATWRCSALSLPTRSRLSWLRRYFWEPDLSFFFIAGLAPSRLASSRRIFIYDSIWSFWSSHCFLQVAEILRQVGHPTTTWKRPNRTALP